VLAVEQVADAHLVAGEHGVVELDVEVCARGEPAVELRDADGGGAVEDFRRALRGCVGSVRGQIAADETGIATTRGTPNSVRIEWMASRSACSARSSCACRSLSLVRTATAISNSSGTASSMRLTGCRVMGACFIAW